MIRPETTTRATRWTGPALIAIAFIAMLTWTWGGWPDPLVDFGRELYVPWQLSQGKVLYRDLAYFNGPLSPYFNSILFRVLGVSLRTLVLANIATCIAMVVMIWKIFRLAGDRVSATVAALLFVTLFMTTQYVSIGNYNWITPYSHELTHGIALSFAAILSLIANLKQPSPLRVGFVGLLLGMAFLTKPEVFIAIAPPIVIAVIITRQRASPSIVAVGIGALIPPIISIALLSLAMPIDQALHGTLGGWNYVFDPRITKLDFYRASMGTDNASGNSIRSLVQLAAYLAALGPAVVIDWIILKERASRRVRIIVAATYAIALAIVLWRFDIGWHDVFRGLPFLLAIAPFAFIVTRRHRRPRSVLRSTLIAFALLLTIKLMLAVRIYHYGFALVMPALLVSAALLVSWIPLRLKFRSLATVQLAIGAVLAVTVFKYLQAYHLGYSFKPALVARGSADEFRADAMGQLVNEVVDALKPLPADMTVAVVPQGVMINYLTGKANPTPFFTLMPPEVLMFGDDKIVAAYRTHPPDILVIVATDLGEYGFRAMDEFAPQTTAWFRANYQPMRSISPPGLPPVTILRRATPTASPR
ncbi:MAG: glycosyltransferase family 39 protein [Anaerolineae bacterium]|nr:glycosyltransferase family 39 protein [Phycisphaerae bacterium]